MRMGSTLYTRLECYNIFAACLIFSPIPNISLSQPFSLLSIHLPLSLFLFLALPLFVAVTTKLVLNFGVAPLKKHLPRR